MQEGRRDQRGRDGETEKRRRREEEARKEMVKK